MYPWRFVRCLWKPSTSIIVNINVNMLELAQNLNVILCPTVFVYSTLKGTTNQCRGRFAFESPANSRSSSLSSKLPKLRFSFEYFRCALRKCFFEKRQIFPFPSDFSVSISWIGVTQRNLQIGEFTNTEQGIGGGPLYVSCCWVYV